MITSLTLACLYTDPSPIPILVYINHAPLQWITYLRVQLLNGVLINWRALSMCFDIYRPVPINRVPWRAYPMPCFVTRSYAPSTEETSQRARILRTLLSSSLCPRVSWTSRVHMFWGRTWHILSFWLGALLARERHLVHELFIKIMSIRQLIQQTTQL